MDCFARVCHRRRPTTWFPAMDQSWVSNDGRKINLKTDVVICVTAVENRIMHALAVNELNLRYDTYVRSCPHGSRIPKERLRAKCLRHINTIINPFYRPYNIFGLDLMDGVKIDRRRHNYIPLRINDGYKLHIPYFFMECVRCIEKFGLYHNDIFKDIRNPIKFSQIKTLVTSGSEFHFNEVDDVLEVAMLLKIYLERMPEGLFTQALEFRFVNATEYDMNDRIKFLSSMVKVLPRINREALYVLISLLRRIAWIQDKFVRSRELNDIFTPVLFRSRWIIGCKAMRIIEDLIVHFPTIFTLKVKQLDDIYKQMSANYPRKLNESLQRRIHQCHCDASAIPLSMRIHTGQMRSYDAFKITLHRQLNFARKQTDHFFNPHYHNHLDRYVCEKELPMEPRVKGITDLDIQLAGMASASQTNTKATADDVPCNEPYKLRRRAFQKVTDDLIDIDFDMHPTSQAPAMTKNKNDSVSEIALVNQPGGKVQIAKVCKATVSKASAMPVIKEDEGSEGSEPVKSQNKSIQKIPDDSSKPGLEIACVSQMASASQATGTPEIKNDEGSIFLKCKKKSIQKIPDDSSKAVLEIACEPNHNNETASVSQAAAITEIKDDEASERSTTSIQKIPDDSSKPGLEIACEPDHNTETASAATTEIKDTDSEKPSVSQADATIQTNDDQTDKSLKPNVADPNIKLEIKVSLSQIPTPEGSKTEASNSPTPTDKAEIKVSQKVADIESRQRTSMKTKPYKKVTKKVTICLPDSSFKLKEKDTMLQADKDDGGCKSLKTNIKVTQKTVADSGIELIDISSKHRPSGSAKTTPL